VGERARERARERERGRERETQRDREAEDRQKWEGGQREGRRGSDLALDLIFLMCLSVTAIK
jgi:hypothetical protein